MTDLDALTAQLIKLGYTPSALHSLSVLARGDEAAHVSLLEAHYTQAMREPPRQPMACRCGARAGLTRLGSGEGRWCKPCYATEMGKRKMKRGIEG